MTVPRRRLPGPSGNALVLAGGGVGGIAWELGNLRGHRRCRPPTGFHQKSVGLEDEPWVVPLPELTVMPVVRVIHQRTPSCWKSFRDSAQTTSRYGRRQPVCRGISRLRSPARASPEPQLRTATMLTFAPKIDLSYLSC